MKILLLTLTLISLVFPKPTFAHSFGALYNLPVPFWMYLYGGAAAIVASFIIVGLFVNPNKVNKLIDYPTLYLERITSLAKKAGHWLPTTLRTFSVFLLGLTVLTGLFGTEIPTFNFSMTFFWVFVVLFLTYLAALLGNFWQAINPWKVLVEWGERLMDGKLTGIFKYPKALAYYPALVIYLLFIRAELFGGGGTPFGLANLLTQYTSVTVLAVLLFGKDAWFRYGELSSVFFSLISKLSFLEVRDGKLYLRPPFIGAVKEKAEHFSQVLFVLFMLSSTAFDGFRETIPWLRFQFSVGDALQPVLGEASYDLVDQSGMILSLLIFLVVYLFLISLMKVFVAGRVVDLAKQFIFSIIPIALVYNVAHYYTLIITEGQNIVNLISDPFGFGWNIFGTANANLGWFVDANFVWHSQVAVILIGHIAGVYLAHLIALKIFPTHRKALFSQFPMLVLMVAYTMAGLWILSQPITSGI